MSKRKRDISRRRFLEGTGASIIVATAVPSLQAQVSTLSPVAADAVAPGVPHTPIHITVNGVERQIDVEDRWSLAELLRDHLDLTGTKIGCDRGECGACTVLMDGKPVYSCSNLAVWADGKKIQTVEGLAHGGQLDPLQHAFVEHDGPQCGFCTSGQLMSAKGLLAHNPHPTEQDVRAAMTGNICRCSNYNRYVEAVMAATQTGNTQTHAPAKQKVSLSAPKNRRGAAVLVAGNGGER